ncbi:SOS response-associated peptidase family protein [Pseudomonas fulva]|nr:SOS response-associated peptidase family protein [Pseudomonas fulva]MBF8779690.1 SOS response-associated peptidase family protein [Pseudomonas fulva]
MCECIVQSADASAALAFFAAPLLDARHQADAAADLLPGPARTREHLVKPKMRVRAVLLRNGQPTCVDVRWGWTPDWSMGGLPLTHLSLEQVLRSRQYARLRDQGRALIPVEGWYEASSAMLAGTRPRLAYITARHAGPLFLAALAQVGSEPNGCDGLALMTCADEAGQQRLLILEGEPAKAWLAADLDWCQARQQLLPHALGNDRLEQLFSAKRGFTPLAR